MTKVVKPKTATTKKAKPELPQGETVETLVGNIEVLSSESPEVKPVIGDEPPSLTLEEVKEVEKVVVAEVIPEPEKEVVVTLQTEVIETILKGEPQPFKIIENEELTIEQKITNYLNDKEGELKINDFLKSLFGVPKFNEPAQWLLQGNSKYLRSVLESMQASGYITIKDNRHRLLGQFYYPDTATGKQQHYNLNTIEIIVKK